MPASGPFDSDAPRPEPSGALVPPPVPPLTAIAADASGEPPPRARHVRIERSISILDPIAGLVSRGLSAVDRGLEQLDPIGDRIAYLLRVRQRPAPPVDPGV